MLQAAAASTDSQRLEGVVEVSDEETALTLTADTKQHGANSTLSLTPTSAGPPATSPTVAATHARNVMVVAGHPCSGKGT
eukprot:COSAG01_NODE_10364_length_2184_cov_1.455635_1_plen_79_part_10